MRILFVISALLVLLATPAFAQSEAQGQQACGNDVFALCSQAIPDRGRIEACLRQNFRRVSPTCRNFMASYAHSRHTARRGERHHASRHHRSSRHHRTHTHHHRVHHHKTHTHHSYTNR